MASRRDTTPALGRDYRWFWMSAAASNLGDGIRLGALPLLALAVTDSPTAISAVTAVTFLPWFLFGAIGGVIVDRGDRRRLMLVGQLSRAALAGLLAVVVLAGDVTIVWLYVVGFGLGVGEVVVDSASQASIPQLVEPAALDRANSRLISAQTVLDNVLGAAVGSLLYAVSAALPCVVDAVSFLVSGATLGAVERPLQGERAARATIGADLREGFAFLSRHRFLRATAAAVALTNLAVSAGTAVLVILVVEELGAPEAAFGAVLAAGAVGGVLGSLVAEPVVAKVGRVRVIASLPFALVVSMLGVATAPNIVVVAGFTGLGTLAVILFNVPGRTLRQAMTPEPLLGRVVASFRVVGMAGVPIGALLGGAVTTATSARGAHVAGAIVLVGAAVLQLRALVHLDEEYR